MHLQCCYTEGGPGCVPIRFKRDIRRARARGNSSPPPQSSSPAAAPTPTLPPAEPRPSSRPWGTPPWCAPCPGAFGVRRRPWFPKSRSAESRAPGSTFSAGSGRLRWTTTGTCTSSTSRHSTFRCTTRPACTWRRWVDGERARVSSAAPRRLRCCPTAGWSCGMPATCGSRCSAPAPGCWTNGGTTRATPIPWARFTPTGSVARSQRRRRAANRARPRSGSRI